MYSADEVRRLSDLLNYVDLSEGESFRFLTHWTAEVDLADDEGRALRILLTSIERDSTVDVEVPEAGFEVSGPPRRHGEPAMYDDRVDYIASLVQETFHREPDPGTHRVHVLEP